MDTKHSTKEETSSSHKSEDTFQEKLDDFVRHLEASPEALPTSLQHIHGLVKDCEQIKQAISHITPENAPTTVMALQAHGQNIREGLKNIGSLEAHYIKSAFTTILHHYAGISEKTIRELRSQLDLTVKHSQSSSSPSSSIPALSVHLDPRTPWERVLTFHESFKIGSDPKCAIQLDFPEVSGTHVEIRPSEHQWIIQDLNSHNRTYLNKKRIHQKILPLESTLRLGKRGPTLYMKVLEDSHSPDLGERDDPLIRKARNRQKKWEALVHSTSPPSESPTIDWFRHRLQSHVGQLERRNRKIVGSLLGLLILSLTIGGYFYYQWQQLQNLENLFNDIKNQKVEIAKKIAVLQESDDQSQSTLDEIIIIQQDIEDKEQLLQGREYQIGIWDHHESKEERLIKELLKKFGESPYQLSDGFIQDVQKYLHNWQTDQKWKNRWIQSVRFAQEKGYVKPIVQAFKAKNLPKQFFYLALQESDFHTERVGPEKPPGSGNCAKGMWQFMPPAAKDRKLSVVKTCQKNPIDKKDERHDFHKSTTAAAQHINHLYAFFAQGSSLLIVGSYNWGQGHVRDHIKKLPPQDRNYWSALRQSNTETKDYVLKVFSAAVIGENPRYFGFNMDNPLKEL